MKTRLGRVRPKVVYRKISPNRSERGAEVQLFVLHSTESSNLPGLPDVKAIVDYFALESTQASSHVVVDAEGNSGRSVPGDEKAWTEVAYNSVGWSVEMIGRASQGLLTWRQDWRQLRETARWFAQVSRRYGVPIRRGRVAGGQVLRSGLATHKELGAEGGGHVDPGPYPIKRLLILARLYKLAQNASRRHDDPGGHE